jgi:hypothetical protein
MNLSLLKLGLVCGVLFVFAFAIARAEFSWNQGQGPPYNAVDSACVASPNCVPAGCQLVDPPVSLIVDGGTNNVIVKSCSLSVAFAYGTCQGSTEGNICYAYASNSVLCAKVFCYGNTDCTSYWGQKSVYSGNCSR